MKPYRQDPPFAVQIELTEGCNLYCDFCGLQGIRGPKDKTFKFLTIERADVIAKRIADAGWHARIEFAMHGEPTMNPDAAVIVARFRAHLPKNQLMMTSNGGGIVGNPIDRLTELFDAGLNVFAFDHYEYVKIGDKIMRQLTRDLPFNVHRYPAQLDASPHRRWSRDARVFIDIKDISQSEDGTHASLNNHCGAGAPPNDRGTGKRCAKPFRELSIRWNGDVAICCNDWRGVYKCGNALDESIESLWQGPAFTAARKFLYRGMREFAPCKGCDALSYRVGLLPDQRGKKTLPKPNEQDWKTVSRAQVGKPLTKAVLRPWEMKKEK